MVIEKELSNMLFGIKFTVMGNKEPQNLPFILNTGGVQYIENEDQKENGSITNMGKIDWGIAIHHCGKELMLNDYKQN